MESHSKRSMAIIKPILYKKSPTLLQIKLWVARVAQGATRAEPPLPANSPFPSTPPPRRRRRPSVRKSARAQEGGGGASSHKFSFPLPHLFGVQGVRVDSGARGGPAASRRRRAGGGGSGVLGTGSDAPGTRSKGPRPPSPLRPHGRRRLLRGGSRGATAVARCVGMLRTAAGWRAARRWTRAPSLSHHRRVPALAPGMEVRRWLLAADPAFRGQRGVLAGRRPSTASCSAGLVASTFFGWPSFPPASGRRLATLCRAADGGRGLHAWVAGDGD